MKRGKEMELEWNNSGRYLTRQVVAGSPPL